MTTEEKVLLTNLLEKSDSFRELNGTTEERSDQEVLREMQQGIELLSYVSTTLTRPEMPGFIKKWAKKLWDHIRTAIANWLREVACAIDPKCEG